MTVVPRWEWRIFVEDPATVAGAFAGAAPERVEESDEAYILSLHSDASAKVRGGRLDVKRLVSVRPDGLEQWKPVLKAAFPVSAADVRFALSVLATAPAALVRAVYTRGQLLDELVTADPSLLAVQVHKRRERHTSDGCMAELTVLRTASGTTGSLAIESEDPDRVADMVQRLGLGDRPVACVALGLKGLVGFGAPRFAVLDVGTNSVKLHIGERRADGTWRTIADRAEVTRLGEATGADARLGAEPMRRTADAVAAMTEEARRERAEAIAVVGTAGLRAAVNAAELVNAVRARSGVLIEVISGDDEARLAYAAAVAGLGLSDGTVVAFDTGGGSTQLTFGARGRIDEQFSLALGAVPVTERFGLDGPVSADRLAEAAAAVVADLGRAAGRPAPTAIAGMGGAVTNLAAVKHGLGRYDPDVVQGTVLDRVELDRQIELYRTRGAAERQAIVGLQPGRAEVILAGAVIVRALLDVLGGRSLTVSDRGLRHGVLSERFAAAGRLAPAGTTPRHARA